MKRILYLEDDTKLAEIVTTQGWDIPAFSV